MTSLLWDGTGALFTLGGNLVIGPGDCCCLPPSSSSGSSSGSGTSGSGTSGSGTSGSGTSGSGSSSGSGSGSGYPCEFNEDCLYSYVTITGEGCPGNSGYYESYEEANQYILSLGELPPGCFAFITPYTGYCCNGQCAINPCGSNCYYCDNENDPECSNPIPGCEEGKTCVNDICI